VLENIGEAAGMKSVAIIHERSQAALVTALSRTRKLVFQSGIPRKPK
jgi:hypothetical protein